ncbi:MAG: arginine repressor [Gemmatimonadota bacterium]
MTPARRRDRERTILEIIREMPIRTQSDLVGALERRGYEVTQATASRDVRRLGLVKVRDADGRSRYTTNGAEASPPVARRILQTTLREFATDMAAGDALLAIRTHSGCANAVAVALDESGMEGVVATLAGDDTILVLTRNARDRDHVLREIEKLATTGHDA